MRMVDDGPMLVAIPTTSSPAWGEDSAIAIVRRSLRRRGFGLDVAGGPMAVVLDRHHPDAAAAIEGGEAIELASAWPSDASIVLTAAGRWWVWEYGAVAPADSQARTLASQASGTRS
ncbi:MAG: hypothetical protein EPO26_10430 [Chloroflexota bacterium]|nr:MAG: hypothetical protein EPO26_10430 [Chloroflexota bacterium]